jgi:uncharacterized NAD-dependent epimerase/dehydratase family protein
MGAMSDRKADRPAPDGSAVVVCEGSFSHSGGKTAHGLVRTTRRYRVLAVLDSQLAGQDAGQFLDGRPNGIPIVRDLDAAMAAAGRPDYLVVGVATHGGVLPPECRPAIRQALERGIHVDSGLHQFLGDDEEFAPLAKKSGARIRDVRRTPERSAMHAFTGEVLRAPSLRVAVLGTDSGVGKRTTSQLLVAGLSARGVRAALVGTGQTAWMQGAPYGLILDSLVNDFVSGEIEHQVLRATRDGHDVVVVEGQGCLTHPAYPGGFEILAGAQPQAVVLQHAPARAAHDGWPDFPIAGPDKERALIEMLGPARVVAVSLNHEGLTPEEVRRHGRDLEARLGIPCCDPLLDGVGRIADALEPLRPPR